MEEIYDLATWAVFLSFPWVQPFDEELLEKLKEDMKDGVQEYL